MWFGVLGHLEVRVDAEAIKISSTRQRTLLASLLIQANQVVSADRLAEIVWDGAPPSGARTTLRSYMMRLRRTVGPAAGARLDTREPGYLIEVADDELDLLAFRQRFQRGRRAERAGAWQSCVRDMTAALQLWRGEPLSDVSAQSLLSSEVPQLLENRLQALESRINAELQLGRHNDVIGELIELVAAHPLREHFMAQLMLALYRARRHAEALDTYGSARHRLVNELGIEPSIELQRLHQQILEKDPSLLFQGPTVLPGGGDGAVPTEAPVYRSPLPTPRQLPPAVQDFTGRGQELKQIVDILERGSDAMAVRIVHIHGAIGVGKTSLAVLAAHQAAPAFPDGQLYISLDSHRVAADVLHEVLSSLGIDSSLIPETLPERVALYRSLLADRRMLLLIDGATCSEHVLPLLPGTAGNSVIVTSRGHDIRLSGAHLFELLPFTTDETLLLLGKIVGDARLVAEPESAERIAEACEGFPLATRIAGNQLATRRSWSVSYLAGRLGPRSILDTLTCQETTMRTAIAESYRELGPRLQQAFRYLSLVGGHDFSSWTASLLLCRTGSEHLVEELRDRSLLLDAESDAVGRPRYRMPGLLRRFAHEILQREPEYPIALDHILTLWTEVADHADAHVDPLPTIEPPGRLPITHPVSRAIATQVVDGDPTGWLEREKGVLLGAVELALVSGMHEHAVRLAARLTGYLTRHHPGESESMWKSLENVPDERLREQAHRYLVATQVAQWHFAGARMRSAAHVNAHGGRDDADNDRKLIHAHRHVKSRSV